jgi:hypothetical protein
MLTNPAKFAPSRSLPPLAFNNFLWDTEVMATLGLEPENLPLALVTSRDSDMVRRDGGGARVGGWGGEGCARLGDNGRTGAQDWI